MAPLALFDLDDTLIDRRASVAVAVAGMCADFGYGRELETWMRSEFADHADPEDFERLRHAFALTAPAAELWTAWVRRMAAAVTCQPAVREGLAGLRSSGWTIGIVTNGGSDIQRAKIHAAGLAELVDGVAASGDINVRKPDPALFQLAADRCLAGLAGGVMTGDAPAGDIGGGHAAGLRTIWLRGRPWPVGVPAPHHTVVDILGAIDILLADCQE
jgi:putative hydrolase of the HAD superfamily